MKGTVQDYANRVIYLPTSNEPPQSDSSHYNEEAPKSKQTAQGTITIQRVLLLAFIIIAIVILGFQSGDSNRQPAPDFTLNVIGGDEVTLSNLEGKVVLLEFMATWCPTCKEETSELQQIHQQYGSQIEIISISSDPVYDDTARLSIYIMDHDITWTVCRDTMRLTQAYNVGTIPALFLIDQNQDIVWRHTNGKLVEADTLSEQIDRVLSELE